MSALLTPANLLTALIALNFITFAAFALDKHRAEHNQRRIREATLLRLALFGGTPGAYAGRAAFRHKTRKQPFNRQLATIAGLHMAGIAFAAWWFAAT